MNKAVVVLVTLWAVFAITFPVAALEPPVVTLERVDVATLQPFFLKPRVGFKDEKEPGKEVNVGAAMNLAYVFSIKNPNKEPLMLDEFVFSTAFDGIEVSTAMVYEDAWIPGGKTNQLRVLVTNEALPTLQNLSIASEAAERLQELKVKPIEMVKKWWETIADFSFPITITGGMALFKDEKDQEVRSMFSGAWGKK